MPKQVEVTRNMFDKNRSRILPLQGIPSEDRGLLGVAEYGPHIPFVPRRLFFLYDVPAGTERGGHAHRQQEQFLICVKGQVRVLATDAGGDQSFTLDTPLLGLHVPAMTWARLLFDKSDSIVLVLTSEKYDEADYIRDRDEFVRLK